MRIVIDKKYFSFFFLILFVFFDIFSPPLFHGIPMNFIIMAFMFLYIAYDLFSGGKKIRISKKSLELLYGFIPFLVYVFLNMLYRVLLDGSPHHIVDYILNFRRFFVSFLFIILTYGFLTCFLNKQKKFFKKDILVVLLVVAVLQCFCILLSFFFESIQNWFVGFAVKNALSEITQDAIENHLFRAYGFSSYYFDALSYVLAGISILIFAEGLFSGNMFWVLASVFISLSSALTARTGIFLTVIGFLIILIRYFREYVKLNLKSIVKGIVILLMAVVLSFGFYENMSDSRKLAFEKAFSVTQDLLVTQELRGVFSQILLADLVFPDNLIFGIGAQPESMGFFDTSGYAIDNGYVQVIWRFGVFGLFLLLFGHIYFFRKIYKNSNDAFIKSIIIAFAFCITLYYIKIYPVNKHGANFVYFVMPLILHYCENHVGVLKQQ